MADKPLSLDEHIKLYARVADAIHPYLQPNAPYMGNMTPEQIVDLVGDIKILEKDVKKVIGFLHEILDSKLTIDDEVITGEKYEMTLTEVEQSRLSTSEARAELFKAGGKALVDKCTVPLEMVQHKYKKVPPKPT